MRQPFQSLRAAWVLALALCALFAVPAHAGSISFGLSLTGSKLTVTNQGNAAAFYPAVYRLLADGRWQQLELPPGTNQPAELAPSASIDLVWPDTRPLHELPKLESYRGTMVRFFDQAGANFGQISFFNQPPVAVENLQAGYAHGAMKIAPPAGGAIRASWLLWPQEDGIDPLRQSVSFEHRQPNARRIEWKPGMDKLSFDLGAGQPAAILLHEIGPELHSQVVYSGGIQGRQQRTAWLDANKWFYGAAYVLAAAAAAIFAALLIAGKRDDEVAP